jgi:hypothetical protein
MHRDVSGDHPLRDLFGEIVADILTRELLMRDVDDVAVYLREMLLKFMDQDALFGVRDPLGRRLESVSEMLLEGDVRHHADSFDREREVHRHIGDFLLFWSGMFPEYLERMRTAQDALLDPIRQGQESYYVVSTFAYGQYADEAPTFQKLSEGFVVFREGLYLVRDRLGYRA